MFQYSVDDYRIWFRYCPMPVKLIAGEYRSSPRGPNVDKFWPEKLRQTEFGLEYLIAALLSRGAVVKDQILVNVFFS